MLIQEYLDKKGIRYHNAGEKNVSRNWINITCPFCSDSSWHCGINLSSGLFNCWSCGYKGDVQKIIHILENKNWQTTRLIRSEMDFHLNVYTEHGGSQQNLNMPQFTSKIPLKVHADYLKKRRFDVDEVAEKYDLWFGQLTGFYRHCLIIPVYSNGVPVCFVAADCTRNRFKYKNSSHTVNVVNHSEVFYNFDENSDKIVLVEGIFDAWRINGTGLLRKTISAKQIKRLYGKEIRIFLDPEAIESARKIAAMIWWTDPEIIISDKEPDDMKGPI